MFVYIASFNSCLGLSAPTHSPFLTNFQLPVFASLCLRSLFHNQEWQFFLLIWREWKLKILGRWPLNTSAPCPSGGIIIRYILFFPIKSALVPLATQMYYLRVQKSQINLTELNLRCQSGCIPPGSSREFLPCPSQVLEATCISWLVTVSFLLLLPSSHWQVIPCRLSSTCPLW